MSYVGQLLGTSAVSDLTKAFRYFMEYYTETFPGSIGYAIASVFFLTKYFGYGSYMCEASGYVYYVIYYANYANELLTQLSNASGSS